MERGVERSLRYLERGRRDLADALGDRPAVLRLERDGLEDEEVERALGSSSFPASILSGMRSLLASTGEDIACPCRSARGVVTRTPTQVVYRFQRSSLRIALLVMRSLTSWLVARCRTRARRRGHDHRSLARAVRGCCLRHALALDRPHARRPRARPRRRAQPAERLLRRLRQRRRVALDGLRLHVGAALRPRSRPDRSARSPSRRPIRTSSTSAPAPASSAPISPSATACTSRPMPGRRGRTSGCATAR